MRVIEILLFLTLVVSPLFTKAAPDTTIPIKPSDFKTEEDPHLMGVEPRPKQLGYFNISVGFSGGHFLEKDSYKQGPLLALRYLPLTQDLPQWDYHAEVTTENLVGIAVGRRWYCCPEDPFLPYLRMSANLILDGDSELGGIAEIRRWRVRASAGVGEVFTSEVGFGLAVTGPDLFAQFGFNF